MRMNNKEQAAEAIRAFLKSDDKALLLTGTHQNEKHLLAISLVLSEYPAPATVLFRTNSSRNCQDFLRPVLNPHKKPKPGVPTKVEGGYHLYVDTMIPRSWEKTPRQIDVAVLYPIGSYTTDGGTRSVDDVVHRGCNKIILVTWTDNRDVSWTNNYNPVRVIYDAAEERPEYHERMKQFEEPPLATERLTGLPKYAESTPHDHLIRVQCTSCQVTRYARLNLPYLGESALTGAEHGKYLAKCLMCGTTVADNYNWYR